MIFFLFLNAHKLNNHIEITKKVEQKYKIPSGLLYAIMQVESRGNSLAIFSNTKGRKQSINLKTEDDAVQHVMLLQSLGVRNINVGCMQINLKYHKNENISSWFSPPHNIEYAGKFLSKLHKQMGSWKNAVAFYHSGSKSVYHEKYLNKINRFFKGDVWEI